MTTINEARAAVYRYIEDNKAGLTSLSTTVHYEGVKSTKAAVTDKWIRVAVRQLASSQQTLGDVGNRKYQRRASVIVQCFVPRNDSTGIKPVDDIANVVKNLLEGTRAIAGLDFLEATITEVPPAPADEGWWQMNVDVRFDYYEIR